MAVTDVHSAGCDRLALSSMPFGPDDAASSAEVVRVVPAVDGSRARVVVELNERTRSEGRVVSGETRNEIRLRRVGSRWRVVGFTALPEEGS